MKSNSESPRKIDEIRPFIRHEVAELFGVDAQLLNSEELIKSKLLAVTRTLNMRIFAQFCHKFDLGVSAIIVISESHVSVHTWPEYRYAHFDIITCSANAKLDELEETLQREFAPLSIKLSALAY